MALDFDIEECCFLQGDLLKMVPGLSVGTLQNWIARGVIKVDKKPHKHAKAYWSAISVAGFRIMIELIKVGLKPSQAATIAEELIQEIGSFIERFERRPTDTGVLEYGIEGERMGEYRRFRIYRKPGDPDEYTFYEIPADPEGDYINRALVVQAYVTIVIELDILFAAALNSVIRLRAGGVDVRTGDPLDKKGDA